MSRRRSHLSKSIPGRTAELSGASHTVRPQRASLHIQHNSSDDECLEKLEYVIGRSWKLHRVSPLYNFKYQPNRLKQYSLRLREWLTSTMSEDFEYKTYVERLHGFRKSEHDTDAVEVTVETSQNGNAFKTIYHGVLLSWGANERQDENFINLPLLLCRGNAVVTRMVHKAFHHFFDCIITQFYFSQSVLHWMNALVACVVSSEERDSSRNVKFIFILPDVSEKGQFSFSTRLSFLKHLWKCVHQEQLQDVVTSDDVNRLYNGCLEHVEHYTGVNLNRFSLYELGYPRITMRKDGSLKSNCVVLLSKVLGFLCVESSVIDRADVPLGCNASEYAQEWN